MIAWLFFNTQGSSKNMDSSEERGRADHGYNVGMASNKVFHYSGAPAARRAAKLSPKTIGTGSHACIEKEIHATFFSW